jgi:hypothetical protein
VDNNEIMSVYGELHEHVAWQQSHGCTPRRGATIQFIFDCHKFSSCFHRSKLTRYCQPCVIFQVLQHNVVVSRGWLFLGIRKLFPVRSLDFFNLSNPSSRNMALGSTQPLTELSTRNFPRGKGRSAHKVDNLTAIRESIV